MKKRIFPMIVVFMSLIFLIMNTQAKGQTSTWNPTTGIDNYEDPANWNPPGIPGLYNFVCFEQLGNRTLTPITLNTDHNNLSLNVFDAHVIFQLDNHQYSLSATNWEPRYASILVGGIRGVGSPVLEIHRGTLAGSHAYVGYGRPSALGEAQESYTPSMSIQSTATLSLLETLCVGYYDNEVYRNRRGTVFISGNAGCKMALVAVDSKLSVINGGSLSVSDLLENQSGGELWIGRPPGTGYPFSNVTARRITLSGTTNIDYGSLSAELYLNTSRGSTSVTGGSQIQSPTAWISGFHPNNSANVTLSGGGSTWTNTLSMYVGGAESAAHGGGMLTISENAMLDVGDQLKIWAPGVVELNEGTINAATIDVEGTFCGTGTVNGNVVNTGVICPGGSTGTLHIIGDYRQNNNGKLLIEIMSPNEGEFDVLHVDGNVVLDGILEITLAEGFIPDPEQNFLVINSTSMAGSFDRVEITGGGSAAVSVNSSGLGVKFTEEAEPEGPSEGTLFLIVIIVIATVVLSLCIYLIRRLIRH